MLKRELVQKPLERQLADLDHHLRLLREQLHSLSEGEVRLKALSAELRVLICRSSGTDGLLWRLSRALAVSDEVAVQTVGSVKKDHPMARGLMFSFVPVQRAGTGPPDLPVMRLSFEEIVRDHDAVFLEGEGLTHDYLIKAVAQQMGSAHEDEGLEVPLSRLEKIFVNGVNPFVPILARDAEFALEIGERVLEGAERTKPFQRPDQGPEYGNLAVVIRAVIREQVAGLVPLLSFRSEIADGAISLALVPSGLLVMCGKRGRNVGELLVPHSHDWKPGSDSLFVVNYCSYAKRLQGVSAPDLVRREEPCDMGWLHGAEMSLTGLKAGETETYFVRFLAVYSKLLSSRDIVGLYDLKEDEWGNWWATDGQPLFLTDDQSRRQGVFPD